MSGFSDRLDDLAAALFVAGVEVGYVGGDAFRRVVAERLLASDWLAEVLAAERERIAVAIDAEFNEWQRLGDGMTDFPLHSPQWLVKRSYESAARIARSESGDAS